MNVNKYTLAFLDYVYKNTVYNTNVLLNVSDNYLRSLKYSHYDNKEFLLHTLEDHVLWFNISLRRLLGMSPSCLTVYFYCWLRASHNGWLCLSTISPFVSLLYHWHTGPQCPFFAPLLAKLLLFMILYCTHAIFPCSSITLEEIKKPYCIYIIIVIIIVCFDCVLNTGSG